VVLGTSGAAVTMSSTTADRAAPEDTTPPRRVSFRAKRPLANPDARFWLAIASAVAAGAAIRFAYLFHGAPSWVGGDGLDYHASALRLADGHAYTAALFNAGAEAAHHPPGWVTLLALVTEAGGRSMWAHQVTGLVLGLGVIVVTGLVGRRYASRRTGVVAAFLAAAYPGFWVIDVQILSEPLGLLVGGLLVLALADLWQRPTLARAVLAGAITGALALVRSEQLLLLVIAVVPILLLNRDIPVRRRLAWTASACLAASALIAPWAVYNHERFEEPVVLSTNLGPTLLAGNCPSTGTYGGETMGSFHLGCVVVRARSHPDFDESQMDIDARNAAFAFMRDNVERLPKTILARYGRLLGAFRPAQTVDIDAAWFNSATWPVWAWITSFWVVVPLAAYGSVLMRRSRMFQWPLVAPVAIVVVTTTVAFGDPRYHTPADLGLVVLAAVALDHLTRRREPTVSVADGGAQSAVTNPKVPA
jgi:4-amino-4-deoxy-L-arabinose transferase-like glycosyltransferase